MSGESPQFRLGASLSRGLQARNKHISKSLYQFLRRFWPAVVIRLIHKCYLTIAAVAGRLSRVNNRQARPALSLPVDIRPARDMKRARLKQETSRGANASFGVMVKGWL
jgi:hypothetical protein